MDERVKGAVVKAVQEGGELLKCGGKREIYLLERKGAERMRSAFRSADPSLSAWGEDSGRCFSICPLDSAPNYTSGFGRYGVMAAYIEGGAPVYGALNLPEEDLLMTAERGKGARINGRKLSVGGKEDASRAIICCDCTAFVQNGKGLMPIFLSMLEALSRNAVQWRNTGSPADAYASVAAGMTDGFVSPLRDAAHAAGYLIMQEAGARLTDGQGKEFTLESDSVLAANPRLHEGLMRILKGAI